MWIRTIYMIFSGHSKIISAGSYVPKQVVSSVDLLEEVRAEERFGIPKTWMDDKLGIVSRRYCEDNDKPSDIATLAAIRALTEANLEPKDLDGIIYCGITGDFIEPGTAHVIQHALGAVNAVCKDVSNACHGFCDGMFFGDLMIGGGAEHILVVTAELTGVGRLAIPPLIQATKKSDFVAKLGFLSVGDAAGAIILEKRTSCIQGIQVFNTQSDGDFAELCSYDLISGRFSGEMMMDSIGRVTVRQGLKQVNQTLRQVGWKQDEIKHLVIHQVGSEPFGFCKRILKFKNASMPVFYNYLGNVTTASLPMGLEHVRKYGKVNDRICVACSGSGIVTTWICITL